MNKNNTMKEQTNKTPIASASRHTPEPWKLDNRDDKATVSASGLWLATVHVDGNTTCQIHPTMSEGEANAARIVACVNALAGTNPEAVKGVVETLEVYLNKPHSATREASLRMELRAALAALKEGK